MYLTSRSFSVGQNLPEQLHSALVYPELPQRREGQMCDFYGVRFEYSQLLQGCGGQVEFTGRTDEHVEDLEPGQISHHDIDQILCVVTGQKRSVTRRN